MDDVEDDSSVGVTCYTYPTPTQAESVTPETSYVGACQ